MVKKRKSYSDCRHMRGQEEKYNLGRYDKEKGDEEGNILVLGIGLWFIAFAVAFAIIVASSLHIEKRELTAEADYVSLALADDLDESKYYRGEDDIRLSEDVLQKRAEALTRHGTDIVHIVSLEDGILDVEIKRTVTLFALPAFTSAGQVDIHASSHARIREYHER